MIVKLTSTIELTVFQLFFTFTGILYPLGAGKVETLLAVIWLSRVDCKSGMNPLVAFNCLIRVSISLFDTCGDPILVIIPFFVLALSAYIHVREVGVSRSLFLFFYFDCFLRPIGTHFLSSKRPIFVIPYYTKITTHVINANCSPRVN